jgi:DNA-binding NarL/FixJ family response regulator
MIRIGVTDDQQLFLKSLVNLIQTFAGVEVVIEANNGNDLLAKLANTTIKPDILLIDVNMPVLDGPAALKILTAQYPGIKTVALSMKDDDLSILSMLKAGAIAYLLKDIHPSELQKAIEEIYSKGFYNADAIHQNYRRLIMADECREPELTNREKDFLELASSDLTYKELAAKMCLSEKTIDGYRESVFQKFNVKSRVGMVLEGLRRKLISIDK